MERITLEDLETADFECCADVRAPLLTVVVAGGGFAGVETLAAVNDFARAALRFYSGLAEKDLRMVLVHSGDLILPELGPQLGAYAQKKLAERGVELHLRSRVAALSLLFLAWGVGLFAVVAFAVLRNRLVVLNANAMAALTMALTDLLPIDGFVHGLAQAMGERVRKHFSWDEAFAKYRAVALGEALAVGAAGS